ncbi:MAG TPA: hypothetical protein VFS23_20170 [Vicinamibacterales bacterium]|nr:hypothetical protein [Vicinamibacterales bacterium]
MTHIAGDRYILIERDDFQGPPTIANPPRQKKLHRDHHAALPDAEGLAGAAVQTRQRRARQARVTSKQRLPVAAERTLRPEVF